VSILARASPVEQTSMEHRSRTPELRDMLIDDTAEQTPFRTPETPSRVTGALHRDDLLEVEVDEMAPWDHLWMTVCSPGSLHDHERYDIIELNGDRHVIDVFEMVCRRNGRESSGRYSIHPKGRSKLSGSIHETRTELDALYNPDNTPQGDFVVEKAVRQLKVIYTLWDDDAALAEHMVTNTKVLDYTSEVINQDKSKTRLKAVWQTPWVLANIPLRDRQIWAATGTPPLWNNKPLTPELYAIQSKAWETKQKKNSAKQLQDLAAKLSAAAAARPGQAKSERELSPLKRKNRDDTECANPALAVKAKTTEKNTYKSKYSDMDFQELVLMLEARDITTASATQAAAQQQLIQQQQTEHAHSQMQKAFDDTEARYRQAWADEITQKDSIISDFQAESADMKKATSAFKAIAESKDNLLAAMRADRNEDINFFESRYEELSVTHHKLMDDSMEKDEADSKSEHKTKPKDETDSKSEHKTKPKTVAEHDYEMTTLHPSIAAQLTDITFKQTDLTVSEVLDQIGTSHHTIMTELKKMRSEGLSVDTIRAQTADHIDFIQQICMAYTKIWFCFPLKSGWEMRSRSKIKAKQLCGQCGETPGDWIGNHDDKSACKATKCDLCSAIGLGQRHNGSDECNIHPRNRCPMEKSNISAFQELVKRRFDFRFKGQKAPEPTFIPDSCFLDSICSDEDEE
jgi:hypothetical protein